MIAEKMANLPNGVRKDRSENSQSYTQQEASERIGTTPKAISQARVLNEYAPEEARTRSPPYLFALIGRLGLMTAGGIAATGGIGASGFLGLMIEDRLAGMARNLTSINPSRNLFGPKNNRAMRGDRVVYECVGSHILLCTREAEQHAPQHSGNNCEIRGYSHGAPPFVHSIKSMPHNALRCRSETLKGFVANR
jgi:hypothetical protein